MSIRVEAYPLETGQSNDRKTTTIAFLSLIAVLSNALPSAVASENETFLLSLSTSGFSASLSPGAARPLRPNTTAAAPSSTAGSISRIKGPRGDELRREGPRRLSRVLYHGWRGCVSMAPAAVRRKTATESRATLRIRWTTMASPGDYRDHHERLSPPAPATRHHRAARHAAGRPGPARPRGPGATGRTHPERR